MIHHWNNSKSHFKEITESLSIENFEHATGKDDAYQEKEGR